MITGIDGTVLKPKLSVKLKLELHGRTHEEVVHFSSNVPKYDMFLSKHACKGLGIVHPDFPYPLKDDWLGQSLVQAVRKVSYSPQESEISKINSMKTKLLSEFKDVFSSKDGLKEMKFPLMKIELKEDAQLFALHST